MKIILITIIVFISKSKAISLKSLEIIWDNTLNILDEHADIQQRCTNLFMRPMLKIFQLHNKSVFL